jgi:NADH-quinone oxidoreductase subunit C
MQVEQLTTIVQTLVPEAQPGISKQYPEFIVPAARLHEVAKHLKENPITLFDYLFCLTGLDRKDGFHVVYHLTSTTLQHTVVLRVVLADKANPSVATVSDLWAAAEYFEREVFDLLGIKFENHPDLRRLFLEDDWVGYPLRKDYKDSFTLER